MIACWVAIVQHKGYYVYTHVIQKEPCPIYVCESTYEYKACQC